MAFKKTKGMKEIVPERFLVLSTFIYFFFLTLTTVCCYGYARTLTSSRRRRFRLVASKNHQNL